MRVLLSAALVLTLAACSPSAEDGGMVEPASAPAETPAEAAAPALTGFTVEAGAPDLSGYFVPTAPIQKGNWRLRAIAVGTPQELAAWTGDANAFPPVVLDFEDVTSPKAVNELGGEYHERSARVRPTAFSVGKDGLKFDGTDPAVGRVYLEGYPDAARIGAARAGRGTSEGPPAMTGSIEIGGERTRNVSFDWTQGD